MPTQQELAREAMVALAEGDFEALHEIKMTCNELGFRDLEGHLEFVLETVTSEGTNE